MFGKRIKLERRVKILEDKILKLEKENRKFLWLINNPCPYKVGQKIKGNIITMTYLHTIYSLSNYHIIGFEWRYEILDKNAKPTL